MENVKAFIKGIIEFRLTITTHYENDTQLEYYDMGRELAHKMTFRKFEPY